MSPREIVDLYLQGRIESWGVYRRLVQLGVTTATALAVATALPAAVQANSVATLTEIAQEQPNPNPGGDKVLAELITHLAQEIQKLEAGGGMRPVAAALARIGAQNFDLTNCNECDPIKINVNDGVNNLGGSIVVAGRQNNITLNLNGTIGQSTLNLAGSFDVPGNNIGAQQRISSTSVNRVNLNVVGNVGNVPLNIFGNLGLFLNNNSLFNK